MSVGRGWWAKWNASKVQTFHYFDAHNVRANRSNCGRVVKPNDAVLMPHAKIVAILDAPMCGTCDRVRDLTYTEAES